MSVRIGLMGVAHLHAASYASSVTRHPGAQLIGVSDHDSDLAMETAARFRTQARSHENLLTDADAVIIASENIRHRELALMAASAGKHVLCEKPLATTIEDGQAMINACEEAGVQLFTAFPCRFSPVMQKMRASTGKLGKLFAMMGTNRGVNPLGWFVDKSLSGGGAMMDHTVHVADLMRWTLGAEAVEVYAETNNNMRHGATDDCAMLSIKFSNGVFATIDASWSRPQTFTTWGDVTLKAIGDQGVSSMDMFAQRILYFDDGTGRVRERFWGDDVDYAMIDEFVGAIQGNPAPTLATGKDGLKAAEMAITGYRSAEIGQPVRID